jgi:hypothetical protein
VTVESTGSETLSGSDPVNLTETVTTAGHGDAAGGLEAGDLGSFPENAYGPGGAVHDGTSQPALDTSQGLVSAIGGQDVGASRCQPLFFVCGLTLSSRQFRLATCQDDFGSNSRALSIT